MKKSCLLFCFLSWSILCIEAQAHRPIFSEKSTTSPESAVIITEPDVSQVIYREITENTPQVWLAFNANEGFELFIQIGIPVLDRLKNFRPAMMVIGPGLPKGDFQVEIPNGMGGKSFSTDDVKEPRFFHEHFTGTDSWILRSETIILPNSGRYYVVAYVPSQGYGKLWLSVGKKEVFGAADLTKFSEWKKRIRRFHEVEEVSGGMGIPILSELFGLLKLGDQSAPNRKTADPCEAISTEQSSKYLNSVHIFADNALKYGRDKHTPLTAADDQLIHVDVFVSGTEGYHTFRIPSVARTADGTLHAFAEGRLTNSSDPGGTHIDLVYKRSTNGGKNWSELVLIDRHPDADVGNLEKDRTAAANAVALVDRTNDRLWLFDTRLVDRNLGSFQTWALYSDDSGVTWSPPQRIRVPRYELSGSSDIYPNLGSGIQMRSGRLIVPATRRTVGKTQSFALYSDDNGAEWHAGDVVEAAVNEAQIVELIDGRLLMSVRPNSGYDRLVAWSSDGGEHWTKPAPLFSSTRVAEAIERYTLAGENDSMRNRLLHTIPAGGSLGPRSNLEIRISYDEGVSFGMSRTVYSGYAAYSDLVNIDSDHVGILWERGDTTSYQFITFTLVNRAFLEPD